MGGLREFPGEDVVPTIVPFVACASWRGCVPGGVDFMDSDKSHAVSEVEAPLAPPIKPSYEAGMAKAKEAKAAAFFGKKG